MQGGALRGRLSTFHIDIYISCAAIAWQKMDADSADTLTLCAGTLCVSTTVTSTGDGEGRRQESSFSFAVCQTLSTADSVQAEDLR